MTSPPLQNRRPRLRRPAPWALACLLPAVLLGAGPPEAVRIRVPAAKVGGWFPPGTELKGMSADEFEALLTSAGRGEPRRPGGQAARLLRARHFVRWERGRLLGRSELVAEAPGPGPADLTLAPWTPAIAATEPGPATLRMHADGSTAVRLEAPATSTATLRWELGARHDSQGRRFALGLPDCDATRLVLDVPEGWRPEGPAGMSAGPEPGDAEGRATWRFDGRGGVVDLVFRRAGDGQGMPRESPAAWVSGPTRIDLADASATWTAEWAVSLDPRGPRRLRVELDEGLELVEAYGPAVEATRAAPAADGGTLVTLSLGTQAEGPTPVTLRAIARVPTEGPWTVPAARPLDAFWTGGRTTVRLDGTRTLNDCRKGSGWRVPARPGEPGDANVLVFEAESPRSVAELVFGRPRAEVAVEVRGQLLLGNASPRLESQLTWRVARGSLLGLDVDLPPAWVPDRVQVVGIDEPLAWHSRTVPGGGVRVHVTPPSGDFARGSLVLNLAATASIAGGRGPIMLPRVRPVGVPVVDERWIAWTESGLTLHPASATGLAWIDPSLVIGSAIERPDTPGLREALAWRWVADQAEARVDRDRVPPEPAASIRLVAGAERDRLRLDWRISLDAAGEPLRSVPIWLAEPLESAGPWRFTDESTGRDVALRPIPPGRRSALGLPDAGAAWELDLSGSGAGPVVVRSSLEVPWTGRGSLPLLALPAHFRSRSVVVVEVARSLQASLTATGVQRLEDGAAAAGIAAGARAEGRDEPPGDHRARRQAGAFGYDRPGGRLELTTESLQPARTEGVIEKAVLTTSIDPHGPCRNRLTLRVAFSEVRSLELVLPRGARLGRVRRDGQAVVPSQDGEARSLPLAAPGSSRNTCTFVLDYLTPRRALADSGAYRPERPSASLPYLAFRWEVVAPGPWSVADHGPGLIAADPSPAPGGLGGLLSLAMPAWRRARAPAPNAPDDPIRSLDQRAAETLGGEMTLAECLTRWDTGTWPLVVDRMAIESAGLGPRSRLTPPRLGASSAGASRAWLNPIGLYALALGDAVLITTRAEAPDRPGGPLHDPGGREAWEERIAEVLARGSDVADRFQAVARWRGEITPRAVYAGEPGDLEPVGDGWRIWRFSASGWPEAGVTIHLVDRRRAAAWAWAAGLSIVALGIACRRLAPRARGVGLAVVLLACLGSTTMAPAASAAIPAGALLGTLAVLFYWAGLAFPRRLGLRGREPRTPSASRLRAGGAGVGAGLLGILVLAAAGEAAREASAGPEEGGPILVLFPFDGQPDLARRPDRAVLRLADYRRLKDLADAAAQAPASRLSALSAAHSVTWQAGGSALVETDLELDGPGTWTFPVGDARDITATVDGVETPVLVRPGGEAASVSVAGEGRRRLRIRRGVATRRAGGADSISLPVNALPSARIRVSPGPAGRRAEVPGARGTIEATADGAEGLLGPAGRLDARWVADAPPEKAAPAGAVEGMLLWDAEPAGDRLRARWTFRNPEGTPLVRLRLEPGLAVRSSTIPGAWDVDVQATQAGSLWTARVDPPMPDGTVARFEFWRPHPASGQGGEEAVRSIPKVEPIGVESYSGAIGFRRPADWSGRLAPGASEDPITEESFVRGWGGLPEEPLTLSGVTRFNRAPAVTVRSGPVPSRLSVQPAVELELGPGRIDLGLDARLTQVSGRSYEAELVIPEDLKVVRVDGEGLTDWSRASRRLLLRFDAPTTRQRTVRLIGWLPIAEDPLATGAAHHDVAVPWPTWIGADVVGGTLTVSSSGPFQLAGSTGLVPLPPAAQAGTAARGRSQRNAYRVERDEGVGRLKWDVEPARVDVQVRSQLTIHPDTAEWVAAARFDVSGGPSDSIRLELPAAWGESAEVKLAGGYRQLSSETRGATTHVTIRPERPIWGSQRLTVRSVRPLAEARTLLFPDLNPIVNGARETYLALVNASGRRVFPGGEGGLQPIDDGARFQGEDFAAAPGLPTWIFRARSEGWSLKVETPGDLPLASGLPAGQARADLAEVELVADGDGSGLGSLRCQVREKPGPFFAVGLPEGATPIWAAVHGTPSRPLRAASGRWLIPVDVQAPGEVTLVWKWPASGGRALPLPSLEHAAAPTFVSLWGVGPLLAGSGRDLDPVAAYGQELARAQRLGRSLLQQIAEIDRSSLRDRERLVSAIVDFELVLRWVERAAAREAAPRTDSLESVRRRIRAARTEVTDALETVGLDDLEEAARIHLGLERDDSAAPALELVDPATPLRLRRLGASRRFLRQASSTGSTPADTRSPAVADRSPRNDRSWTVWAVAVLVPALGWGVVRRSGRPGFLGASYLVVLLGIAAAIAGPLGLLAALGATVLGGLSSA